MRERHDEKRTRCAADWRAKLLLVHNRRSAASPHGEGKQTRLRTRLPRPLLCVRATSVSLRIRRERNPSARSDNRPRSRQQGR